MTSVVASTQVPPDMAAAIGAAKRELCAQLGSPSANTSAVTEVFAEVEAAMRAEVAEVVADRAAGREVVPVVRFADIEAGTVPAGTVEAISRRGCAVVRGTFDRRRAEAWDVELAGYLEANRFAQ